MVVKSSFPALVIAAVLVAPAVAQEDVPVVTLSEAIELAVIVNPNAVQARGEIRNAELSRREAFGNYLPSLSTNTSVSTNSSNRFDEATQRVVSGASTSYSAGLSASMEIFSGFRRGAQMSVANANIDAAQVGLISQQFTVALQTKQAYFNALAADELVRVSERRIERATQQLAISKQKLAAASATRSDTLRSTVELANARLQLLNAETQRANSQAELARLVGVDGRVRPQRDESLFVFSAMDTAQVRLEAIQNSPAILQAESQAEVARAQTRVSRAQWFPSISASARTSWAGQEISGLRNSWSVQLGASWPIFNGFTREANNSRSQVAYDNALARAEDARRQAHTQLTQYLNQLAAAQTRQEIAMASQAAAGEDLRVQQERYRLGVATIIEVLDSQVSLDQAEVDEVQARFDLLIARAQIEALIGRSL